MPDLYSTGAGLIKSAADTTLQVRGIEEERRKANLAVLQSMTQNLAGLVGQKMQEAGAMRRQEVQGQQQQELQKLQGLQQQDLQRQKQEAELMTLSKPIVNGLAKRTGDTSWLELEGERLPQAQVLGLFEFGLKQKMSLGKVVEIGVGKNQKQKALMNEDGSMIPLGTPYDIRGDGGDNENQKKLKNLDAAIKNDQAIIGRFLEKHKDIPKETGWLKTVSRGTLGGLSDKDKADVARLKTAVNRLRQSLTNEQKLTEQEGMEIIDRSDVLASLEEIEGGLGGEEKQTPTINISTKEEYDKLPKGARYIWKGKEATKQ